MGFLQPAEVVKLLLEKDDALYNRIIYYNALDCDFDTINTARSLHCNLCGISPTYLHQLNIKTPVKSQA
jgi:hypothetical protein